jgi:uncharacterized protein
MNSSRSADRFAVAFAIVFPTIVTWVYFVLLAKSPAAWQQAAYGIGKVVQFGLPVAWFVLVRRQTLKLHPPRRCDFGIGGSSGLLIVLAAALLYFVWLKPGGHFAAATDAIRAKVAGMGIDSPIRYAALGLFYALGHSLLEEYYWRWFVFGELRRMCALPTAIAASSVGFMAHHIIVLALFFGWSSPLTVLFSLSVAIGGALWAWVYHKTDSLYGPWFSHLLVDAGIFLVGYDLVRDVL